jgi:Trk-type K+ transport system membrane component
VTTFFLLAFVLLAEVRGEPDVVVGHRRISAATQRQALTVALFGVALVFISTLTLQAFTSYPPDRVLFEALSAFATVGLSTGLTPTLPPAAKVVLVVLMFLGRVGTITVATGLALRGRKRLYRHPEERPIVG